MTPICKCHGEPAKWTKDNRYRAGGYWRCRMKHRVHLRISQRRRRERMREEGICTRCGTEPAIGVYCWSCLNYMEENRALSL